MPDPPIAPPASHPRLAVLDGLRGVAALWVGLYHFTQNGRYHAGFPAEMPLRWLGTYGYLGVYAFFVISGFILPWTMDRSGYQWRDYGRFLGKRVLRLHPLYLLSVGAMLVPFLVGAGGGMAAQGWPDWWPHFFYLNGVMQRPWLMQIYWTLALEAQYYLAVGLLFPLLAHRQALVRGGAMLMVILVPLVAHDGRTVLPFAALFGMGLLIFQSMSGRMPSWMLLPGLLGCAGVSWWALGLPESLTALISAGVILGLPLRHRVLGWLGEVSYPFYLFHLVVSGLLMPWILRLPRGPWTDSLIVLGLIGLSLAVAGGLHRLVEVPAQRWSSAIRYRLAGK
jgi:peptidoglycan/LPS O-acetylase OafA/YrhL